MLAAVLHDFNELILEEVPRPHARNFGEVVVQIKSCGFCATDYKAIKGIRRNVKFPFIPGHEPSGVIVEVGPGVVHFKEGDEVILMGTDGIHTILADDIATATETINYEIVCAFGQRLPKVYFK